MALARFFDRVFVSAGGHVSIDRPALERQLGETVVAVHAGEACDAPGNARWIAELTTNLLARLYPRLALLGSSATTDHLAQIARRINPGIELGSSAPEGSTVIVVGGEGAGLRGALFPRADGWVARLHAAPCAASAGPPNPYAAAAAASLTAAEVFRRVFNDRITVRRPAGALDLSLLDFGTGAGAADSLPPIDLSEVAFVGLGAVANGALWALGRHEALAGRAHLIDDEVVDLSNLQRYALTGDADEGRPKVDLASAALSSTRLQAVPHRERLPAFAAGFRDGFPVPVLCVSVDNAEGRRQAQALLPRVVVNGWTGDAALGASRHVLGAGAPCLACLYQPTRIVRSQTELVAGALGLPHERAAMLWVSNAPPAEEELAAAAAHLGLNAEQAAPWRGKPLREVYTALCCGSAALPPSERERGAAVPLVHQSVLAGVLMAVELLKAVDPALGKRAQPPGLVRWGDVLRPPPATWVEPRQPSPNCFCADRDYVDVYREKWGAPAT